MKLFNLLADGVVLAEIGRRVAQRRLSLEMTQAEVALRAGIAKRTLERLESGHSVQLSSLVRVLRVLNAFTGLDRMLPEDAPEATQLLTRAGKVRQRVSVYRASGRPGGEPPGDGGH